METALESVAAARHVKELNDLWPCRALKHTQNQRIGAVLLSVLSHTYDETLLVFLQAAFPGCSGVNPPAIVSAARISKTGAIVADFMDGRGNVKKNSVIYKNEIAFRDDFRRLADQLKLSDTDRVEMFKVAQRWVVADRRLDPNFDPQDPDAKRIIN